MMTYLRKQIPGLSELYWWKTKIQESPRELVGPVSVIAGAALLVRNLGGKHMAGWVVTVAVWKYPAVHSSIRHYMVLDQKKVAQAAKCLVIPLFCMIYPPAARVLMSVQIVLIGTVLKEQWKNEQKAIEEREQVGDGFAEEKKLLENRNSELAERNQQLERGNEVFAKEAADLEIQAKLLSQALSKLVEKRAAYRKGLEGSEEEAAVSCIEVIKRITSFCATIDESFIDGQLKQIDENNQKIGELLRRIKNLSDGVEEERKKLSGFVQQIGQDTELYSKILDGLLALQKQCGES
jgi:hypothetical protein